MSVRRKPKSSIEAFIRAATVDQSQAMPAMSEQKVHPVKLRIDDSLLARIDEAVSARRPVPSRHQWILEAIYEKLERSSSPVAPLESSNRAER